MKPILFNTDMVRAILEGRKTVTRRLVKFKPRQNPQWTGYIPDGPVLYGSNNIPASKSPYHPGDILYVRETWYKDPTRYMYKANYSDTEKFFRDGKEVQIKWRPSIHMPKEAARLFLRVTDVRVERLQKMTIEDFQKEGIKREEAHARGCHCKWATETCREEPCSNRDAYEYLCWQPQFRKLWDSTIDPLYLDLYAWSANPWVWVISFERISKEAALKVCKTDGRIM